MKIALYIEEGLEQIVLTPETDVEGDLLEKLHSDDREFEMKRGSFFECRGGWLRYGPARVIGERWYGEARDSDKSTMIVLRPRRPKPDRAETTGSACEGAVSEADGPKGGQHD